MKLTETFPSTNGITDIHLLLGPLALTAKGSGSLITATSPGRLKEERAVLLTELLLPFSSQLFVLMMECFLSSSCHPSAVALWHVHMHVSVDKKFTCMHNCTYTQFMNYCIDLNATICVRMVLWTIYTPNSFWLHVLNHEVGTDQGSLVCIDIFLYHSDNAK